MFAARHLAMLAADDGRVFGIDAFRLRRFALLFHRARFAAFAAAIRHVAASLMLAGRSRVAAFHRAGAVLTAAAHFGVMRLVCFIVGKNHDRESKNKQDGNCQDYSFFHYYFLTNLEN